MAEDSPTKTKMFFSEDEVRNPPKTKMIFKEEETDPYQRKSQLDNDFDQFSDLMLNIVRKWEPKSETFALRRGPIMLAVLAVVPSIEMVRETFIRSGLGRGGHNAYKLIPFYASSLTGAAMALISHTLFVSADILTGSTPCGLCVQTRAMATQLFAGVLYPAVSATFLASNYTVNTQRSKFYKQGALKTTAQIMFKHRMFLMVLGGLNILSSYAITMMEQSEWRLISSELIVRAEEKMKKRDL